jgi:hypothetical protein
MSPDESPKAKYERLQRRLQQEILTKYPNPERKGCPGDPALRSLVARPLTESVDSDPVWQHVTHCSECYREFLEFQSAVSRQRLIRREAIRWGIAVAVLAMALVVVYMRRDFIFGSKRPQNAELAYNPRTINIESMSRAATRGTGEQQPYFLSRDREALTIQLPVGSRAGEYEFQLRTPSDQVILTKSATAKIDHGVTSFLVKIDLTSLQPGQYKMEARQVPFDWQYYPVVLR